MKKMKWKRQGLIYRTEGGDGWRSHSALQPTPLVFDDKIRFFVGFRDAGGVSRVGYVDVAPDDPRRILRVSERPVLDIGVDGAFDESGVVPSAVIRKDQSIYLYYAGYQLGTKVRFLVLSGLAVSTDGGETFRRHSATPIFERTEEELLFRVPHTVMFDEGRYKFWYGGGSRFMVGKNKTLPVYDVRYLESPDGIHIPDRGRTVMETRGGEYRIGRPCVVKSGGQYQMFYGYSSEDQPYRLGHAVSEDGLRWTRLDDQLGLDLAEQGWDSEMMAYPSVVTSRGKTYLFYNGNRYGAEGFGCAERVEE